MQAKQKNAWLLCVYVCAFAAACVWILNKCRIGFAGADESFYLTIPLRLVRGDGLFVHEWHLSQMASFLMLPLMFSYMKIAGTTVGIALAFRYIFTAVWIAGSLWIFWRLRRVSLPAAVCASLLFVLFAPFGIMALSYNSLGIFNLTLSCVLLCTAKGRGAYFAAGVLFAAAVLCCPYLATVYFLYSAAMLVYGLRHRDAFAAHRKDWLFFTIGTASLAILFAAFVFSRASLSEIADALPQMFSDPEHRARKLRNILKTYVGGVAARNVYFKVFVPSAGALLAAVFVLRKNVKAVRILYILTLCATMVWLGIVWTTARQVNFLMFPMQLMAVFALITVRDKQMTPWRLFGVLPAILYSICIHLTSNMAAYSISAALAVDIPAVVVLLVHLASHSGFVDAKHMGRRLASVLTAVILLSQIAMETVIRYTFTFWEEDVAALTQTVTCGPEKGLRTTSEEKAAYERLFDETRQMISADTVRNVLFLSSKTYLYLTDPNIEMATYSAWQSGVTQTTLQRLEAYYALHPDREPQVIYYDTDSAVGQEDIVSAAQAAAWAKTRFGLQSQKTGAEGVWFS